eukprot:scaffold74105_cov75-Phaeocystis_antarctica.AAC.5
MPKLSIHEPKLLNLSVSSGGHVLGFPAQPAFASSYRLPAFISPNCIAENKPAPSAASSPDAPLSRRRAFSGALSGAGWMSCSLSEGGPPSSSSCSSSDFLTHALRRPPESFCAKTRPNMPIMIIVR